MVAPKGEKNIAGKASKTMADIKTGIQVDTGPLKKLSDAMDGLIKKAQQFAGIMNKVSVGSGSGSRDSKGFPQINANGPGSIKPGENSAGSKMSGVGSYLGDPFKTPSRAFATFATIQAVGSIGTSINNRMQQGANYAATVDRMNLVLQQQSGVSQSGIMAMRKTMTGARLGQTGINDMMQFQIQNGYKMTPQMGQSIAGVRAMTGYSKSAADVLAEQQTYMDPTNANRMFNTLGVNAYGMGGKLNDPIKMRQQIVQRMGLTNAAVLRSAKGPGSVTRARLEQSGIADTGLQDEILTYAEENLTFKRKGGKGNYDPSKNADRKRMGIEGQFATRMEDTEMLRQKRNEDYARNQLTALAQQEKTTQSLIKALGGVENAMRGVIGSKVGMGGWGKVAGGVMSAVGTAAMFMPSLGIGQMAGVGLMAGGAALQGDATGGGAGGAAGTTSSSSGSDASTMVPVGYKGQRASLNDVKNRGDFKSLNPKMQDRLLNMMRANPNVGLGGGSRDSGSQEKMFRSRYRPTTKDTGIFWQGQYWEHVSGAQAAPPGGSFHEIGLAADLVGDMAWITANANKFGLKNFAKSPSNEPWHVQLSELPDSRYEYEKNSGKGHMENGTSTTNKSPVKVNKNVEMEGGGAGNLRDFSGMSMSDIYAAMNDLSIGGGGGGGAKSAGKAAIGSTAVATPPSPGALDGKTLAQDLYAAGFRGDDLLKMMAVAGRESGWRPSAFNGNSKTGDLSYGLFQINMKDKMGPARRKTFGLNKNEDLFDPMTSARAAHMLYSAAGLQPWGGYKGETGLQNTDKWMPRAQQGIKDAGLGDPMGYQPTPSGGSMTVSNSPSFQINVSPQISFSGTPTSPDLRKIANEVTALIEQNVRTLEMRGA